jgi:hypothetical protein
MKSAGAISASNYPLIGPDRQCSGEKSHTVFTKRPFQTLIGDLISFPYPEITLFSNNAGRDIRKYVLVAGQGLAGKGFLGIGPGRKREGVPEMRSSGAVSASVYPHFGPDRQCSGEKPHPDFRKWPFQHLNVVLISRSCPEISTFSNNPAADSRKDGLVAVTGGGRNGDGRGGLGAGIWQTG